MKKIVSLLLVAVMILSVGMVSAFAYTPAQVETYKDRFVEEYGEPQFYEELMWHYSDEGNTVLDWVFITVATEIMIEPIENPIPSHYIVGDIVYSTIYIHAPFLVPYCVYDVAKDEFIPLLRVNFDEYEGLREFFCNGKYGKLIGDINKDDEVSILDATELQRVVAKLAEFDNFYVADFNRDNNVNIYDATAIQMKLAKIEEKPTYNEDLVIRQAYYFDYDSFPEMPQGAEGIEFELLETYDSLTSPGIYFDYYDGDLFAIIKTKAQYDEVLDIYNDRFGEEFFDDKYLVVSVRYVSNIISLAPITDLRVLDNTLYIRADEENNQSSEPLPPIGQYYTSIVAVDKSLIENVADIVRVK